MPDVSQRETVPSAHRATFDFSHRDHAPTGFQRDRS